MGRFIFTLFSALAQLEREQIAEQTSTAMLRHQAKGRRMTRPDRWPRADGQGISSGLPLATRKFSSPGRKPSDATSPRRSLAPASNLTPVG